MSVTSYLLPAGVLIVPNLEHFFGEVRNQENCLDVIATFSFKDTADIYLVRFGAIGVRFADSGPLRSIMRLQTAGSGIVPDHVMRNHDEIVELQSRRLHFANFIAAALFGRLSARRHTALTGAQYAGMDEILAFAPSAAGIHVEDSRHSSVAFSSKVRLMREEPQRVKIFSADEITDAVAFVAHLGDREDTLAYANLQACMVMNYQAAILHGEQHSAASLALNFSVAEALIHEIFLDYGIVGGASARPFATRAHTVPIVSSNQFSRWRLGQRIKALADGGLVDSYLRQRLDEARVLRNNLMHSAAAVSVRDSGTMQTVVRDLWMYVLDGPFELMTSWSMRI